MKEKLSKEKLVNYILGNLPEDELLVIEQEIFSQDETFEQIQILKEQLLEDYTNNKLTTKEQELFEQQFLNSPWRRERVVFAQAMNEYANQSNVTLPIEQESTTKNKNVTETSFWQSLKNSSLVILFCSFFNFSDLTWRSTVVAAVLLFLVTSVSWLFFDNRRLKMQIVQLQQTSYEQPKNNLLEERLSKELARIKELEQELAQVHSQTTTDTPTEDKIKKNETSLPSNAILSFILAPQTLRSEGGLQRLEIPRLISQIELIVKFQSSHNVVYAQIATIEGEQLWHSQIKSMNKGNSKLAKIKLKSSSLPENDYILTLTEINAKDVVGEKIGEYPFRILKK